MSDTEAAPVGSPPKYKTPEELQLKIDEFINNPPTISQKTRDGETCEVPSLTITGLCWFLGFESRQSFYDYGKKPEFSYTIKRAKLYIESKYEEGLRFPNCTGSIFVLKCMGWDDKSGTQADESIAQPLNISFEVLPVVSDVEITRGSKQDAA
jgi:hypothetical protein